jgi:hypothetical protein
MQLSNHHPPPWARVTPQPRPQPARVSAPWPFYVQAPRPPCFEMELNARRVLEVSARYFSAPMAEPVAATAAVQRCGAKGGR